MRAREFLLIESGLQNTGLRQTYLDNLIKLITIGTPISLVQSAAKKHGKRVFIKKDEAERLQSISDETAGRLTDKRYLNLARPIGKILLAEPDANDKPIYINLSDIEKSSEIKGKESDYNLGDIGEIALGISAAGRFNNFGIVDFDSFVDFAKRFKQGIVTGKTGSILSSKKLIYSGTISYRKGKEDQLEAVILGPGRSIDAFSQFINSGNIPQEVSNVINSAIVYVNEIQNIENGLERIYLDPNKNLVQVVCDGVSNQRGTKADITMLVDGTKINVLSAKTGKSQLGQVSGHDWNKQKNFFNMVFGIPLDKLGELEKDWGATNGAHLEVLKNIYSQHVIPRIERLTGTNSVQNEKDLIKGLVNGLTRYSNNVNDETGQIETVDIVKLIVEPGSPGYKLLRIDSKLNDALMNVDLYGKKTPNNLGIEIFGIINNIPYTLFKIRSYESKAGNVIRTILEGGPLLDELAVMKPGATPVQAPPQPTQVLSRTATTATSVQSKIGQPMGVAPVV